MMNRIYEICLRCMEEPVERKQPIDDQESVNYCPECGGEMTIMHIYEICPCCMDELIEREQAFDDQDSINYCPKCGHKLEWALLGDKIDDTMYKIILNDACYLTDHLNQKNRFLEELMRMGNFTLDEAIEKCKIKDCLIFEGDAREIYIKMDLLDGFTPDIHYTIIPEFPFMRLLSPFISICPTCGSDTIHKTVDVDVPANYVHEGFFCEKCNEWVIYTAMPKGEDSL